MRVLLVSPSSVGAGAAGSGGVAGYIGDLAAALVGVGCEVGVLSSGHVYRPGGLGRRLAGLEGRCEAEELAPHAGVRRFQIVNSPVLSPALWQFGGPEDEARCRAVERAFGSVLRRFEPDVVHVHGFEGFSAGIVWRARRAGARVLASVHNYHAFCPQVYLLRGRRAPCADYEGGLACESCEGTIDIAAERRRRAGDGGGAPSIEPPERAPIMTFAETGEPTAETLELWRYEHAFWQPIDDGLPDAVASVRVDGRYGGRRAAFVRALNACDAVVAVSAATGEICRRMGVEAERVVVDHIGSWAADVGEVGEERRPAAPSSDEVLRLVFLGFGSYPKGLGVLCDAVGLLTGQYQKRISLVAHGVGVEAELERAKSIRPGPASIEFGGRYERSDVPGLLSGAHAAVVPSVWHDNGPQTAIEARALGVPVIGARIGGIPDIIADGVDGLLFRANDRADLARVIAGCVRESGRLRALRATVRPWRAMEAHAGAMVGLNGRALSSGMSSRSLERA